MSRVGGRWLGALVALQLAGGCSLIAGHEASSVDGSARDSEARDATSLGESARPDLRQDATADAIRLDIDAPPDFDQLDAPPDKPFVKKDVTVISDVPAIPLPDTVVPLLDTVPPDVGPPDVGPPPPDVASPANPCNSTVAQELTRIGDIAFCEGIFAQTKYDQCGAHNYCNVAGGWDLCPASTYKAAFTATKPPNKQSFWLKGCVRDGGSSFLPKDELCSACTVGYGSMENLSYYCPSNGNGFWWKIDLLYIGITTFDECRRAVVDDPSQEAHWEPEDASLELTGAVCCPVGP